MSAILSEHDLNDFISPGVACIKPVETLPAQPDYNPYEVTTEDKLLATNPAPAAISLTDCLACSGCVTSAEAVLISLQSHSEVLTTLDDHAAIDLATAIASGLVLPEDGRIFVASVSPQVRASIAATYNTSEKEAGYMIDQFLSGPQGLKTGGKHGSSFSYVVDTNRMREACLVLGADEVAQSLSEPSRSRPILTSACPGWICYAEKTHPHVLPHLSKLKSPQALTGTLLKSVLSKSLNIHTSQIWHLAIMPCFDKKLEASRSELTDHTWHTSSSTSTDPVRDVDCVITTRELLTLASARNISLHNLPLRPLPSPGRPTFPHPPLAAFLFPPPRRRPLHPDTPASGTSGGYLHHVLQHFQSLHPGSTIATTRGRNTDVVEYTLTSAPFSSASSVNEQPKTILKAARYYGFRNIQNLVRKLKPPRTSKLPGAAARRKLTTEQTTGELAYVEVMACPGGCTNGGGQVQVEDVEALLPGRGAQVLGLAQRQWKERVDEAYFSAESSALDETDEADEMDIDDDDDGGGGRGEPANGTPVLSVRRMLSDWAHAVDVPIETLVYTTYRTVESDVGKKKQKGIGDTERIAAIAGASGGGW